MGEASGGSSKAFFTNVDGDNKGADGVFYVQFNPKEFKLDEKASWKASDEHQKDKPLLTYEKGEPTTVSMDLIFDSTDSGDSVYTTYVQPLRSFLSAAAEGTDKEGNDIKRPPYVNFTWGGFSFDCVVEKMNCTFLMFKPDGTPLRAKVSVGLKERVRPTFTTGKGTGVTLSAMGSLFDGAAANTSTYTVQQGDTLSTVASNTGQNATDIAVANDIADPMNLDAGQQLVIPADSELAAVLAAQALGQQPGNWGGSPAIDDPFGDIDGGGDLGDVPSSFDDINDLGINFTSAGNKFI